MLGLCLIVGAAITATAAEPAARVSTTVRADAKTGRLVRRTVNPNAPKVALAKAPPELGAIIQETAQAHDVDPLLVDSVIQVESNFNPFALSPKGAEGLMQLIPSTARRFGVVNSYDARENITAGVKYLKYLQELFGDNTLALAAYNAGEAAVLKHGGVPPYRETEDYVRKVGARYGLALQQKRTETAPVVEKPRGPEGEPLRQLEVVTDEQGRLILRTR